MKRVVASLLLVAACSIPDEDLVGTKCTTTCGGSLVCVNGVCQAAGGSAGGSTAGGSTAGGSMAGGSTAGGSTAGGSTAGGSTAGGSMAGGSTAGGSTAGGSAGGSTAGGSTAGGSAGGSTAGGSAAGGSTAGGSTAGGSAAGGSAAGGSAAGGSAAGGSAAGGSTAGGAAGGVGVCTAGERRCAGGPGSPVERCVSGSWEIDGTCAGVCVDGGSCQDPPAIAGTAVAWLAANYGYTFDAGVTGTPSVNHCAWLNRSDSGVTGSCLANGHACIPPALISGEPGANGHRLLGFDALLPRNSGGSTEPGNCIGLRGPAGVLDFFGVDYAVVVVERHGNDPTWHLGVDGGPRSSNYGFLYVKENSTGSSAHPSFTANSNEFLADGGTHYVGGSANGWVKSADAGYNDQRLRVVTLRSSGGTISLRINGVVVASQFLPDAGMAGDGTPVVIGGRGTDWARLHGAIGEVLAFKGPMNDQDLLDVENHLMRKFGIP